MCVRAEAKDCHLSGYIYIYISGRTGGILILERHKYKKLLYSIDTLFHNNTCYSNIISFEHSSLLNERPAELPENIARQVLGFRPNLGMQHRWPSSPPNMS